MAANSKLIQFYRDLRSTTLHYIEDEDNRADVACLFEARFHELRELLGEDLREPSQWGELSESSAPTQPR